MHIFNLKMAQACRDDETVKLIELWGESNVQEELDGCRRNKHVYEKISVEMGRNGFKKTGCQCREKIKKLKAEYKKVKDSNKPTGTDRKSGKYFSKLNKILGNKPATKPSIIVDSLRMITMTMILLIIMMMTRTLQRFPKLYSQRISKMML